jgi:hypothetical protein
LAVTTPPLFIPLHFATNRECWERLMDAVHLPYFAGIAVLFFCALRANRFRQVTRALAAGFTAVAWAGAVEILQPYTGRTEDIIDFRNGSLGVALAVVVLLRPRLLLPAVAAGLGLSLWIAQPAWREFRSLWWRASHFPLLGDFESDDELRLWQIPDVKPDPPNTRLSRSTAFASRGRFSLQIATVGPGFPGVRFLAEDQDWRPYAALACDIYNPGKPFNLGLRIDDSLSTDKSNRFNGSILLQSGWNSVRLPLAKIAVTQARALLYRGNRRTAGKDLLPR